MRVATEYSTTYITMPHTSTWSLQYNYRYDYCTEGKPYQPSKNIQVSCQHFTQTVASGQLLGCNTNHNLNETLGNDWTLFG